ncbi:MAG: extensin family protein, partial [Pseudomonadota bacterium]
MPRSFAAPDPKPAPTLSPEQMVCKDPRLQGRRVPNVTGPIRGCLIIDPVKVTRVAGIKLSNPATLDCRTARTFANWVTSVADPAARDILGARITNVWIMGTYSCRTRN